MRKKCVRCGRELGQLDGCRSNLANTVDSEGPYNFCRPFSQMELSPF